MHRLRHVSDSLHTAPSPLAAAQPDELLHAETHRRSLNLLAKAADPAAESWRSRPPLQLSAEQLAFFDANCWRFSDTLQFVRHAGDEQGEALADAEGAPSA